MTAPLGHETPLSGLDDVTVARLARLNMEEFSRELARWSGQRGRIVEQDGVLLFATATEFPVTCNGVARLDPRVPDDRVIALGDSWFGELGRGYTVQIGDPLGVDAGLVAAAEAAGLVQLGNSPALVCRAPLSPTVEPEGIELRWLGGGALVDDFVAVSDTAYQSLGMPAGVIREMCVDLDRMTEPHLHTVVAYDGDIPLAAAQLLLSHGIGGVYYVGTVEAARGRGLGELVTRAVTNRAFDLGAAFASLQATEMGDPIYRRMGYEQIGRYRGMVRFF